MEDQYGMGDLRQYMNGRPLFHGIQQSQQDLCLNPSHPYDMLVFRLDNNAANHNNHNSASACAAATTNTSHHHHHLTTTVHGTNNNSDGCNNNAGLSHHHVLESTANIGGDVNCGNNNGRWPRQETLTLLEIRSRLDTKFKEANQKGPLWDEVSRIMSEEHGYQRSGKKCREKFENLYKYYKKTKEGKAGRQDGKHYRFFRQLEALYGESQNSNSAHFVGGNFNYNFPNSNNHHLPLAGNNQEASQCHNKLSDISLSLSNCSETDTTSSEDSEDLNMVNENDPTKKQRRSKKSWKVKIKDFIDAQMKKLMDKQEAWMEKMVKTIEQTEQERILREEEWRRQDAARIEREHAFWARERAWIEARDTVLMDALHKFSVGNKDHHHRLIRASPDHQEEVVIGADIRHDDVSETIDNNNKSSSNNNNNNNNNNNAVRKGDIWPESEMSRLIQLRSAMEVKFQQRLVSEDVLWEEVANKMACFGHDRSGLMCKDKWDNINNYAIKTCNKKRKENSPSPKSCTNPYYLNNHESGGGGSSSAYFGGSNEQKVDDVMRLNEHHGNIIASSPNNNNNNNNHNNAENSVSDSCFRYFMGDAYGRMIG